MPRTPNQSNLTRAFGTNKSSLDLNTFRTEITGPRGTARTNRFEVRFNLPAGHSSTTDMNRTLSMRVESVNLPGVNLSTAADALLYGPPRDVVDGVLYAETISMTIIMDGMLNLKQTFEEWQYLAFDPSTWDIGYYNEYTSNIDIYVLDSKYIPVHGVRLWEAFPKTLGAIAMSNADDGAIAKLPVDIEFRYWTNIAVWSTKQPWEKIVPDIDGQRKQNLIEQRDEDDAAAQDRLDAARHGGLVDSSSGIVPNGDPNFAQAKAARDLRAHRFREGEARRAGISPTPDFKPNGDPDFAQATAGKRARSFRANEARRFGGTPSFTANGGGGPDVLPRNRGTQKVMKSNGGGNKTSTATKPFNITTVGGRDAERPYPTATRTANRQGPHKGNPNTRPVGGPTEASNVASRAKKCSWTGFKTFPVPDGDSFHPVRITKLHPPGSPKVLPTNRGTQKVMKANSPNVFPTNRGVQKVMKSKRSGHAGHLANQAAKRKAGSWAQQNIAPNTNKGSFAAHIKRFQSNIKP